MSVATILAVWPELFIQISFLFPMEAHVDFDVDWPSGFGDDL